MEKKEFMRPREIFNIVDARNEKKTRKIIHQVKECAGFYSIRIETRTNVCCCFSATYLIPLTSPLVRTPSSKTTNDYAKFCPT